MDKKWALTNSQTFCTSFIMIVCMMWIAAKLCSVSQKPHTHGCAKKTNCCYTASRSVVLLQLPESCGCDQSVRWPEFGSTCYNGAVQRGIGTRSPVHWTRPLHRICGEFRVARTRLQSQFSVPANGLRYQWQSVYRSVKSRSCTSEFLGDRSSFEVYINLVSDKMLYLCLSSGLVFAFLKGHYLLTYCVLRSQNIGPRIGLLKY
jgi:hypothetical protein